MKTKILLLASLFIFLFSSCDDVLDRPSLDSAEDDSYWTSEVKVRLYANEFYGYFFPGYGYKYSTSYAALMGYAFNDDMVAFGNQPEFERSIPSSKGIVSLSDTDPVWQTTYTGPTWNFAWIRKSNIMINRIETRMEGILDNTAKNHWLGVARFFRAMEYARLVQVFGDVPYYDHEIDNSNADDLYKARTPRAEVMDAVYDDFIFAMNNVKTDDGSQSVNKYVVAAFVSRLALVEGTWQKYHYNNTARAIRFLQLAVDAADIVRSSGKYDIITEFRTLFGSSDLTGNKDCIFYRKYDSDLGVTHAVASNCNMSESRNMGPSLALIKSFICNDGRPYQNSTVTNAAEFDLANLVKTRDPRFEASFYTDAPVITAKGSYLGITKFISRKGLDYLKEADVSKRTPATEFTGSNNVNGYPVMRYAEVLLNWIEAKMELELLGGGPAVTQSDIDLSINKLRDRPLDTEAINKGVQKTAHLNISTIIADPNKDPSVTSSLLWEIRRERRMELAFEHSRVLDLRRWKKLEYMDTDQYPDLLRGIWINFPVELPNEISMGTTGNGPKNVGILAVTDKSGNLKIFDGNNGSTMIGFYSPTQNKGRQAFLNQTNINPYLSPIGTTQRVQYKQKGYDLAQTEGWSDILP